MIVGAWPTRLGQVLVEEGEFVPAGTPLLSLTETGFTVTLSASASDRTKLEVGQAVTVTLVGGTQTAPGVISELDESATVDPETGQQSYEGKVELSGDLGAADGALVSIDVVIEERVDVITVPIAAVKQNGQGQDVVRVIDIEDGGTITEVPVTTGLSEGSFIEITSGLEGDEVVIVEVDTPAT
jgi:multidrug efflux pump subunit AcrA (membrane-fusion protein)